MALKESFLISPDGEKIVGVKLQDGGLCTLNYLYDSERNAEVINLNPERSSDFIFQGESHVFVDEAGAEWSKYEIKPA